MDHTYAARGKRAGATLNKAGMRPVRVCLAVLTLTPTDSKTETVSHFLSFHFSFFFFNLIKYGHNNVSLGRNLLPDDRMSALQQNQT